MPQREGGFWVGPATPVIASESRLVPRCPVHAVTGLYCPGCGLTRAMVQLRDLDLMAALRLNLFAPVLAVLVVWTSVVWIARPRRQLPRVSDLPSWVWKVAAGVVASFGVVRNLPMFEILQPL